MTTTSQESLTVSKQLWFLLQQSECISQLLMHADQVLKYSEQVASFCGLSRRLLQTRELCLTTDAEWKVENHRSDEEQQEHPPPVYAALALLPGSLFGHLRASVREV